MSFSIYYQNVNGLKTKINKFRLKILYNSYDVILLSETWLNENIFDAELFDDRYIVCRNDRDKVSTDEKDGGGCLIAVKKCLISKRINEWEMPNEDIWISVDHVNGYKTFFNVRYIPLKSKFEVYKLHYDKISEILTSADSNDTFVMTGDYNLNDSVNWCKNSDLESMIKSNKIKFKVTFDKNSGNACAAINIEGKIPSELINLMAYCNLNQFNSIKNKNSRVLDLILSNVQPNRILSISRTSDPLVDEDGRHPAIEVSINLSTLKFLNEKRPPKTNFYRANYVKLNSDLSVIYWDSELNHLDIDGAVNRFYDILETFIETIPKTKAAINDYPIYYNHELIRLIEKKA